MIIALFASLSEKIPRTDSIKRDLAALGSEVARVPFQTQQESDNYQKHCEDSRTRARLMLKLTKVQFVQQALLQQELQPIN